MTETNGETIVTEDGATDIVHVVLTAQPETSVSLAVSSGNATEVTTDVAEIAFTVSNWNAPQAITIQGVDDQDDDQDQDQDVFISVAVNAVSSDQAFANVPPQSFLVTNVDDDDSNLPSILGPVGAIQIQSPIFEWAPVANAVSYELFVTHIGAENNPVLNPIVTETSYAAGVSLPVGRYRTWVQASLSGGGKSNWASDVFQIDIATQIHEPPLHTPGSIPTISWDAVNGAIEYRVYVSNLTTRQNGFVDQTVQSTTFTPNVAFGNGRHRVWVRPVGANNFQARWSDGVSFNISPIAQTPAGPQADSPVTFSWTPVSDAQFYQLYISGPRGFLVNESEIAGTATSYAVTAEFPTGDFRWWMRAAGDDGRWGPWSPVAEFSTGARTKVRFSESIVQDSVPVLAWAPVPGAESYEVYLGKVGTVGAYYRQAGIVSDSFRVGPLENGDYRVWIRTVLTDGRRVWGRGVAFTIDEQVTQIQTQPIGPMTAGFDAEPVLQWIRPANAVSFDVWVINASPGPVVAEDHSRLIGNIQSDRIPLSMLKAGEWKWQVRSRDVLNRTGPWSAPVTFNTDGRARLLAVSASSTTTPAFTWEAVSGAERYVLQVDNLTVGIPKIIREDDLATPSYLSPDVFGPGRYRAWVRAIGSGGLMGRWSFKFDFEVS